MKVHPQVAAASKPPAGPDPATDPMGAVLAERAAMLAAVDHDGGPPIPLPVVTDVDASGVPCRLYATRAGVPVLLYLHGGGWVAGSVETVDRLCRRIAHRSGCAVLSVDYRLAPEHPFPAPIHDAETALAWLRREAPALGVDATRVAIGGDSAGGHLATVVARRERDAGRPLDYQVLVYPVIDPTMSAGSYEEMAAFGLDRADMGFYWNAFAPAAADRLSPDASPLAAPLTGMPPTLLITAEYDVLRDEGEEYAAALVEAGVPVVTVRYQGVNHAFARKLALFDAAGVAADHIAVTLRAALTR
jgi:acetyl esterase/lipase